MEHIPVSDITIEKEALSTILAYNQLFTESQDYLNKDMFYDPKNQIIYEKISDMISKGERVNTMSLWAYIGQHPGDIEITIDEVINLGVNRVDYEAFPRLCKYISDLYKRRELYRIGVELITEGSEKTAAPLSKTIEEYANDIRELGNNTSVSISSMKDALQSLNSIAMDNCSGAGDMGVPTGFKYFDGKGGFRRSELIIIGGRSGNGKTSLALDMTIQHAMNGNPIAYYSMEMPKEQLAARAVASVSGVSSLAIMRHPLNEHQFQQFDRGMGILTDLPIFFDENPHSNIDKIIASIRTMVHKKNIAGAYIDYLQILSTNERNVGSEESFYGKVARRLKDLALELNIFIVLLSQINRNKGNEESFKPTVDQIRGSGQINEAADLTILVYRPELYKESYTDFPKASVVGTGEIIIGKGRHIGVGEFLVNYDGRITHFSDIVGEVPMTNEAPPSSQPEQIAIPNF